MDFNFGRKILQRKSKIQLAFPAKVKVQQNMEMFIYKFYYDLETNVLLTGIHKIWILKPIRCNFKCKRLTKEEFCVDIGRVWVKRLCSFKLLLGLPSCLFPSVSPICILCAHLVSHMHATSRVHLICFHLENLAVFPQELLKKRNCVSSHYCRQ